MVGLSGGADSVALARRPGLARAGAGASALVAAHLDHGLRPDSADDAAFCAALCARLGVPFRTGAADVRGPARRASGGGLEEAARRERYAFLRRGRGRGGGRRDRGRPHARRPGGDAAAPAPARRRARPGLAAHAPPTRRRRSGRCSASRGAEVLAHLRERGLAWREDPSNADLAHRRNRVRHELLPYLEERFNPRVREALARTAALLADEAAHVRAEAEALARPHRPGGGWRSRPRRASLARRPPPLARAALRQALARAGGPRARWALSTSSGSSGSPARRRRRAAACPSRGPRSALHAGRRPDRKRAEAGTKAVSSRKEQ